MAAARLGVVSARFVEASSVAAATHLGAERSSVESACPRPERQRLRRAIRLFSCYMLLGLACVVLGTKVACLDSPDAWWTAPAQLVPEGLVRRDGLELPRRLSLVPRPGIVPASCGG